VTPEEFDEYMQSGLSEPVIRGTDFLPMRWDQEDRLLCKGWHLNSGPNIEVWLNWRQEIGRKLNDEETEWRSEWATSDLYPSKRAYREDTDLRFAVLMRERHGYPLSFAAWRDAG